MKKIEFIEMISKKLAVNKKQGENVYDTVFNSMINTIREQGMFKIVGLGTFSIVKRASRKGVNLQTGKPITIPAKNVLKFKVSKKLKDEIAK